MATVNTVRGPIDGSNLGYTLVHEHLRIVREQLAVQLPHIFDRERDLQRAIAHVKAAKALGVKTICDATVMGLGRDVQFVTNVAELTGMNVIVGSGIYTLNELVSYFGNRSVDHMVDIFYYEAEVGIQGTDIRPAFLKCASDLLGITPGVEKVLIATARAHRRCGLPIMTHSHAASKGGLTQQDILEGEGVDLGRVLIGHSGDSDDVDYLRALLDRGSFIGMDRYGMDDYLSTELRNRTVISLCGMGYVDQLMLSQDYPCFLDSFDPEDQAVRYPNWNLTYVMREIIPALREAGITEAQVQTMMVDNPRRWLELRSAY